MSKNNADTKAMTASRKAAGLTYHIGRLTKETIEARRAEIPRYDTRGLTARICGDPLPERSALHRRMIEEQR